jgi:hypothetical protein
VVCASKDPATALGPDAIADDEPSRSGYDFGTEAVDYAHAGILGIPTEQVFNPAWRIKA